MRTRFGLRPALTVLFVGAGAFFLGAAIIQQGSQLKSFEWSIEPLRLLLSVLILICVLAANVVVWGYALRQLDQQLKFSALARIWFLSNLARYMPGKIWQFVGIAELGRSLGVPVLAGVTSIVVYMGYVLLAAWFVGIYLLPPELLGRLSDFASIARILTPASLVLLHPRILASAVRLVARITRQECAPWQGGWGASVVLFAAGIVLWLAFGAAFFLFIGSLTFVTLSQYPALTAIFALAFVAGYVIVVAPAGLGAKEGFMAALLSSILPLSVAAAVAVASRVWSMAAELAPALAFAFARRAGDSSHD
jgi:uncharacterized membrane protein YbhN (UPF0104 family)